MEPQKAKILVNGVPQEELADREKQQIIDKAASGEAKKVNVIINGVIQESSNGVPVKTTATNEITEPLLMNETPTSIPIDSVFAPQTNTNTEVINTSMKNYVHWFEKFKRDLQPEVDLLKDKKGNFDVRNLYNQIDEILNKNPLKKFRD